MSVAFPVFALSFDGEKVTEGRIDTTFHRRRPGAVHYNRSFATDIAGLTSKFGELGLNRGMAVGGRCFNRDQIRPILFHVT
jgi:hypothetical protein